MNIKTKTKFIILIILIIISSCSVVFGRYVVESEKTEFTTINIKTCDFIINNFNRYGTLDLYLDGKKVSTSISSFNRKMTIGTTYEIKNIKPNEGYILETDINSLKGTINNSTTISLSFKTTSYSISYTLNGGNLTGQNKNYTVESNNFTLPTPTKAGYDFVGWTGTGLSSATKNVTIKKGSTGNRSYTANWTPTNYSITYNLNGGSISGQKTSYNIKSNDFTLPTPTRNGYTFNGWTGTGLSSATKNVKVAKGSTGNKSYTANWSVINYTISYNANGGSISGQKTSYNIETASFNLVTPSRTGYSFRGWTGTGLSGATKTVTVSKGSTGNRSYTANWVDDIRPTIHGAWITSGPTYEVRSSGYGYRVNIQVSCSDSGSGINRVLTYYDLNGGWTGETNITGSMTDSFWFKPGYRKIRIVVFDNAGNSSETVISVQCG